MSEEVAIKVENVSKSFKLPHQKVGSIKHLVTNPLRAKRTYEMQHALKNIDLEIKKGEFFGIVGRNGSGKSTLLKILAGIYQPTKGKVQVNGKLVPFIELGVGFNPELTGRENVYLNGALLGFSEKEIADMYDDIVEFAELEKFMDQKLKNYSSGMQVRLAFSMATRSQADILLIDEVLAVGDADFQRKCFNYFKSLKKSGATVVFVSHDMDAVREYCDRAILIEENHILQSGDTDTIAQHYTKLFMGAGKDSKDSESAHWGGGEAKTQKIIASTTGEIIKIEQRIQILSDIENPIIGLRIKSASGAHITGTNTKIEKIKIGTHKKDTQLQIVWEFPNVLADGNYYVDAAINASDGITVYDWWDDSAVFAVKKEAKVPYDINPGFKVSVEA